MHSSAFLIHVISSLSVLTEVPLAIWSSIITGTVALAGVYFGQRAIDSREQRREQRELDTLRDALISELRSKDDPLERLLYATHDLNRLRAKIDGVSEINFDEVFKSDSHFQYSFYRMSNTQKLAAKAVYDANAAKVGKLKSDETSAVINAYLSIDDVSDHVAQIHDSLSLEEMISDDIDWSTEQGVSAPALMSKQMLETSTTQAILLQKHAIAQLGGSLSDSDRIAATVALLNSNMDNSESQGIVGSLEQYIEQYDLSVGDIAKGDHPLARDLIDSTS